MDLNAEESFRSMGLSDLEYLRTHIDHSDSLDVNVSTPMGEDSVHSPAHSRQDDFVSQASVSEDESGVRQKKKTQSADAEPMPFMPRQFNCDSTATPRADVEAIPLMHSQISTNSTSSPTPRVELAEN